VAWESEAAIETKAVSAADLGSFGIIWAVFLPSVLLERTDPRAPSGPTQYCFDTTAPHFGTPEDGAFELANLVLIQGADAQVADLFGLWTRCAFERAEVSEIDSLTFAHYLYVTQKVTLLRKRRLWEHQTLTPNQPQPLQKWRS